MQNDGKTANYIGEAVILLTADHLGIETEMLDIAKQVWHLSLIHISEPTRRS